MTPLESRAERESVARSLSWESAEGHTLVDTAVVREFNNCMRNRGFIFSSHEPVGSSFDPYLTRWGPVDPTETASFGYGEVYLPQSNDPTTSPEAIYFASLDESGKRAFEAASFGPPESLLEFAVPVDGAESVSLTFGYSASSCTATSFANTFGSFSLYLEYEAYRGALSSALAEADDAAVSNPIFQLALSAWQDCMALRGYDFVADPLRFADEYSAVPSTGEAIRAATSDVDCKLRADLMSAWWTALADSAILENPRIPTIAAKLREQRRSVIARNSPSAAG